MEVISHGTEILEFQLSKHVHMNIIDSNVMRIYCESLMCVFSFKLSSTTPMVNGFEL